MPTVQSLRIEMYVRGERLSVGTGFVVTNADRQFLVTNRHNLAGRRSDTNEPMSPTAAVPDRVVIVHNKADALGTWITSTEPLYADGGVPLWQEHPVHGRAVDVVALPLTVLDDVAVYPHDLVGGFDFAIHVTSEVHVVGFPFGLVHSGSMAIWTRGAIATEWDFDFDRLPRFLIDARTRPGQSGSPVLMYSPGGTAPMADGGTGFLSGPAKRLLGIYSGRINAESDLGFVWRTGAIGDVVSAGVRPLNND